MKVLIAEDEPVQQKALEGMVRRWGYEPILAATGTEALEKLQDRAVQLAVLDWMLPEVDGLEICRRMQNEPHFVYCIVVTARGESDDLPIALDAGASDFLQKPYNSQELFSRLKVGERITSLQMQLAHSQKLESIGQLAAGIAHEINTPTQFVGDNLRFLRDSFGDLCGLQEKSAQLLEAVQKGADGAAPAGALAAAIEDADLGYLLEEIPRAIEQSLEGVARVGKIVGAMKEFSHPGTDEKTEVDLNKAIESTITVAKNEWKYVSEVVSEYDAELPMVPCLPSELNQVFLNILVNAAHAIKAKLGEQVEEKGTITVSTRRNDPWAEIRIQDTGSGVPAAVRSKIFDPFFTTKEVGKGTGQGLALSRSIVVDKHGGEIDFETEEGEGTTFIIRIPLVADGSEAESGMEAAA